MQTGCDSVEQYLELAESAFLTGRERREKA